jgi:8-oxo-dGTP diphosphatase
VGDHPRHVVAVSGFVTDPEDGVLLVRVASRGWEMPGGQVENGENLLDALRREVEEETGCRVGVDQLIGVYSKVTPPEMVLHLFRCRYVDGEARPREEAVPKVGWFAPEAARGLVTHPPSAQRLADALSGASAVFYRVYRLRPYEPVLEQPIWIGGVRAGPNVGEPHWPARLVGAAAVVVDDAGRVLLVRHTYGRLNWELPGGASEPEETFAETAIRELREETGLAGQVERLAGIYYKRENDSHHLVFRCKVADGFKPRPSSDEISACEYWPAEALPRPISDFTVRRIEDALADDCPRLVVDVPLLTWLE